LCNCHEYARLAVRAVDRHHAGQTIARSATKRLLAGSQPRTAVTVEPGGTICRPLRISLTPYRRRAAP
jgi:hypothetical protein